MADQDGSDASPPESQGEFRPAEKFAPTKTFPLEFAVIQGAEFSPAGGLRAEFVGVGALTQSYRDSK